MLAEYSDAVEAEYRELALSRVNATDVAAGMIDRNILERARAAVDSNFDRRPAVGAQLLIALGEVYSSIGLVEEALPLFQRARQTRAELLGPDHPNTLQVNANVTLGLLELNRLEEAEAIALAAVAEAAPGREVVVAGRREVPAADEDAAAVLDDGTARMRLLLGSAASAALRESLRARVLLVSATTARRGGEI